MKLEHFDQEVFNAIFHLKQTATEVLSWPSSFRRVILAKFLSQRKFDEQQAEKRQ